MGEYLRSQEEFLDLLDETRSLKEDGATRIIVYGSTVKKKGDKHRDIDLYAEYPVDPYNSSYDRNDYHILQVLTKRSGVTLDVRRTHVPFEESIVIEKTKRVIFQK